MECSLFMSGWYACDHFVKVLCTLHFVQKKTFLIFFFIIIAIWILHLKVGHKYNSDVDDCDHDDADNKLKKE